MTPVFLLEELQKFISSKTSDIILPVRTRTGSNEEKKEQQQFIKWGCRKQTTYNRKCHTFC